MLGLSLRSSLVAAQPRSSLVFTSSILAAQRRLLSQENRAKIQEAIKAKPVVLFMKGTPDFPECGFSRATIQVLELHGVDPSKMQTYNVLADSELRQDIKEFSDWPTIPQLYVNGEFVGGCDILLSMHQSGELEKFLQENKVVFTASGSPTS
ncbi:monothiol glutaredoxin-5 [Moniliophthora roreri MCA 2997]|uniref:Monothiol glutaredoxin-5, mitochondrial n=1 Tax=Moniliophthora roreri (strain MCA 2997) TaxID=1381753 RepID=V2X8I8_MONRO|nr:monothiol glutaredoxin-5 [Moniliophthora roreri MCA 2997]KAI3615587.1 monothiol glutaredoxin-5 [Moniliophthora roreri]